MTHIAFVKDGAVIGRTSADETVVGLDLLNHRLDEPKCDLIAAGIYELIQPECRPPAGMKVKESVYVIDDGFVTESHIYVDMTPEEIRHATNCPLDAQIDALERQSILPRIVRDNLRQQALREASALGLTEANLLDPAHPACSPGYMKFMALHNEIADLRKRRI